METLTSQNPTPRIETQPPLNSNNKRAISEVISETSPTFDHRGNIVEPFDNEAKRDLEFQEKLSTMLIELMLEFHAWSISRPSQETDRTADILEKEINALIETEKEQGMSSTFQTPSMTIIEKTRRRLSEFVDRIKLALAALTGL